MNVSKDICSFLKFFFNVFHSGLRLSEPIARSPF